MLEEWINWVNLQTGVSVAVLWRVFWSVAVIVTLWLARVWVQRLGLRSVEDARVRYQWRKTSSYIYYVAVAVILVPLWFGELRGLATYLGLITAGVAIALRDPLTGIVGWGFILWRRPFSVGDRIQIGEVAGDVIDQRLFQFTLMEIGNWVDADQSTGRVIHIPNGKVFTDEVANYSTGFRYIWNEIPVTVTFESDWREAKAQLGEIAVRHAAHLSEQARRNVQQAANRYMLSYATLTPIVYTSVVPHGVRLTARYLCEPRQRRGSAQAIWEDVLEAFEAHPEIVFAYPTQRFYNAYLEGGEGDPAPEG
jgi:small-conductance mechanosensitive channel